MELLLEETRKKLRREIGMNSQQLGVCPDLCT